MNKELCFLCDEETGMAGPSEDSIFDHCKGGGPYCLDCWREHKSGCIECRELEQEL